jgi:methyltransferase (TIGR00027 family)
MKQEIQHVSDTAMWIAAYRAQETERSDAVFKDPLAAKLAGPRGFAMVRTTPFTDSMAFAMVVRTSAIDRLVLSAIAKGVDTVINIGAGLDTRPYRMPLPPSLSWIEVDFQSTIDYKNQMLAEDRPVCKLQRIACDLSHDDERRSLFRKLGAETSNALIITEGVIGYLTNEQAKNLSEDLYAVPSFRYWIMDHTQGRLRKNRMTKKLRTKLVHAPLQFKEKYPLEFFGRQGWKVDENIFILDEADRFGRKPPLHFPFNLLMVLFPRKFRELGNKTYGYVMFGRP